MTIQQLLERIKQADSLKELNKVLSHYLSTLGIHSYAFTYYDLYPSSQRPLRYSYVSPALEAWHHHFIASQYEDVDQTLKLAKKVAEPILWDVYEQLKEVKQAKEARLREESIEFGVHKGLLIPIHGPGDEFSVLVLHQRKGENWLDQHPEYVHFCFLAGYYYYGKLVELLQPDQSLLRKFKLTRREMQCLELTSKGYLARDIAKTLHITERTANFHIQNLNKKLGVSNKYQAIAKARVAGLLNK